MKKKLTILDFAKRAGKHPVTVRRWIKAGVITATHDYRGAYQIEEKELKKVNA